MAGVNWWDFYFRLFEGSIRSPRVVEYLRHLSPHLDCELLVVWDGARTHRSRLVWDHVREQKGRLWLAFLPAYAPELNPRVSVVALEATRTAELLPAELLATEPSCSQSTSPHAQPADSGYCVLGTSRTNLIRQIVLLVPLIFIAIAFCPAQGHNDSLRKPAMSYETL